MKIENSLFDASTLPKSHNLFSLNIVLKSSSVLYLTDLSQAEKEEYVKYFNSDREDSIFIYVGDVTWRISPQDVERIAEDSYPNTSFKAKKWGKALLSESVIPTSVYFRLIKLSIIVMVLHFMMVGVKIFTSGKPFDILINKELLSHYISNMISGANFAYFVTLLLMIVITVIDFMFETAPKYGLSREYRSEDTGRLNNIIVTSVYLIVGYLLIFGLSTIFKMIFLK